MLRSVSATVPALSIALVALPACGPPPLPPPVPEYRVLYSSSAPVFEGERVWFTVVREQGGRDSRVFLVECPRSVLEPAEAVCSWHLVPEQAPGSATPSALARARAGGDHGCVLESVRVLSGDPTQGFWLDVCGHQRFYRHEAGAWVDRTP